MLCHNLLVVNLFVCCEGAVKALQCTRRFGKNSPEAETLLVQFVQVGKPVEITQVAETGLTVLFSLPKTLKTDVPIKEKLSKSIPKEKQIETNIGNHTFDLPQGGFPPG